MGIGTSIVLIAVGAILRYAISVDVSGIDIPTVGTILMVLGVVGLLISLLYMFMWDRDRGGHREREVVEDIPPPRDRYSR